MTRTALSLIYVPYDSGRRGERMGAGPIAFAAGGIADTLRAFDCYVDETWIDAEPASPLESAVDIARTTSRTVREARAAGRFPVVIAGNCITTVGAVAGAAAEGTRVVWFDAHGDLNTPASSSSGFLDGMAAAVLLGWCHAQQFHAVQGYAPLDERRLMLIGTRDLDEAEARVVAEHGIAVMPPVVANDEDAAQSMLHSFLTPRAPVWLHFDLDALDPAEYAPANTFATPDGLMHVNAIMIVMEIAARADLLGLTLSAYDPAVDPQGLVRAAALPFIVESLPGDGS